MIVTTTNSIEGREIREYRGIVFGEVITGINVLRDIGAGFRNFFGGRSAGYEEERGQRYAHGQRHGDGRRRLRSGAHFESKTPFRERLAVLS